MGIETIIGAGLGLVGSVISSNGNKKAATATANAAAASDATNRYIYDDTVRRNAYREGLGNQALGQLGSMYGLGQPQASQYGGAGMGGSISGFGNLGGFSNLSGMDIGSSSFSPSAYLDANPSIRSSYSQGRDGFGNINDYATAHWQAHGQREGRPSGQATTFGAGAIPAAPADVGGQGAGTASPFQSFYDSPDYQLAFSEGQKAIEGSAANRGGLLSGSTGKAIVGYGQDLANTTFGNYKNSLNNIAGLGQQANNAITNAGTNYAGATGNNAMMVGQANAQAAQNNGNMWGGIISGFGQGILNG